jgi:phosphoribosyl 1,2-cyclic phosphodiesterase
MKIRFWGVRGSLPAPLSADTLSAKMAGQHGPEAVRSLPPVVGGNTACVSVQVDDLQLILDGGSGLCALGADLMRGAFGAGEGRAHLFLSHTHWDHIQGIPFFAPLFVKGNQLDIYGGHAGLRDRLAIQQRPEFFPVPLDALPVTLAFHELADREVVDLGRLRVLHRSLPHPGGSFAYRVETIGSTLVYATDGEYTHRFDTDDAEAPHLYGVDVESYVSFFRGADTLIFDAMYGLHESIVKAEWGHSTALIGVDLAARAGVKRLVLFHHDRNASDESIWTIGDLARDAVGRDPRQPSLDVQVAFEGMELQA